jgi:uracil-DNA glycosylase family 4
VSHRENIARKKRRQYMDWTYWGRPVPSLGDPSARLLIIGLAPAAHGGNRTGRIFTGDRSGEWLFRALYKTGFANQPTSTHRMDGLTLKDCYITAVIHCAPPDNKPTRDEILNCRPYLINELKILRQARVVVALGRIAFDNYLETCRLLGWPRPSPRPVFGHGKVYHLFDMGVRAATQNTSPPMPPRPALGQAKPDPRSCHDVTLIASYHPSQQNTLTGRLNRRMFHSIFMKTRKILDR